ncbi:MAG: recombinase family protein [Burkholderiaceae bacterium]
MPRTFAYLRVSTTDQTTENQLAELTSSGFTLERRRVITETISGSVPAKDRPGFRKVLDKMESGDILVVTKLDRLGRNAMDVRSTVEELQALGIRVHCIALGGMDLTSPAGKMTMNVIAAMAEFEKDLLIERTRAGLARAKAEGKSMGRPSTFSPEEADEVRARLARGEAVAALAKVYKTTRQTIMRTRDAVALVH